MDAPLVGLLSHEDQERGNHRLREYPALRGPTIGNRGQPPRVRAIWPQSAGWTEDGASEEEDDGDPSSDTTLRSRIRAEGVLAPGTDPRAAEDATFSRYEPETGFGTALFDARNGFNEVNRYLMLWNVAHQRTFKWWTSQIHISRLQMFT